MVTVHHFPVPDLNGCSLTSTSFQLSMAFLGKSTTSFEVKSVEVFQKHIDSNKMNRFCCFVESLMDQHCSNLRGSSKCQCGCPNTDSPAGRSSCYKEKVLGFYLLRLPMV